MWRPGAWPQSLMVMTIISGWDELILSTISRVSTSDKRPWKRRMGHVTWLKGSQRSVIGTVSSVKEKTISLKIADSVKVEVSRASVSGILEKSTI